jgi:hypothetical protein
METELVICRVSKNKLSPENVEQQANEIASAADKRQSSAGVIGGWADLEGPTERPDGNYYEFTVKLTRTVKRGGDTRAQKCLDEGIKFVKRAAEARKWQVKGDKLDIDEQKAVLENRPKFVLNNLTPDIYKEYFDGIYEREPHIRLIHASAKNACDTNFEERNHVLLYGEPAAAKTILFRRLKTWYEVDNPDIERVALINSVTLSKAGLETWLLEKASLMMLPEIIFFDEIEKFDMNNLSCLLGIMDEQATISRMNAKIGKVSQKANPLIWATCNDVNKLKAFNNGALFSRFVKQLPCLRPSRELMEQLLLKRIEIRKQKGLNGDAKWARRIVQFCFDEMKVNDPRMIIGMLDGGDDIMSGDYFKDILAIEEMAKRGAFGLSAKPAVPA